MITRPRTTLAAVTILTLAVGCSKTDPPAAASTSITAASPGSASSGCADKLATFKPGATAEDKKNFASACGALSAKAQTCIAGAEQKDMDGCLADKADKDAFMGAMFGAAAKAATAAAAATNATKLDKVGLQMDVPGEAMVGDGIGARSQMVNAVAIGGLTVSEAGASTAKTLKAAKSEAKMFNPKNVQGEQTSDGYWLTFENTGSMGTNYWVKSLRQIGGKAYVCEGSPDTAAKASAALAACKTLRP
jgi:hypothetical protein